MGSHRFRRVPVAGSDRPAVEVLPGHDPIPRVHTHFYQRVETGERRLPAETLAQTRPRRTPPKLSTYV
jgi:hypothetical protein